MEAIAVAVAIVFGLVSVAVQAVAMELKGGKQRSFMANDFLLMPESPVSSAPQKNTTSSHMDNSKGGLLQMSSEGVYFSLPDANNAIPRQNSIENNSAMLDANSSSGFFAGNAAPFMPPVTPSKPYSIGVDISYPSAFVSPGYNLGMVNGAGGENGSYSETGHTAAVPEPEIWLMMAIGAVLTGFCSRRRGRVVK